MRSRITNRTLRAVLLSTLAVTVPVACGKTSSSSGNSNTNWLSPCQTDADCGDLACECGVCTLPCGKEADCDRFGESARCAPGAGVATACTGTLLCLGARSRDGGADASDPGSSTGGRGNDASIDHASPSTGGRSYPDAARDAGALGPSCSGTTIHCGLGTTDDCCAADLVPGGTFDRLNDSTYPATVRAFRLDRYEITVGRFRRFVDAYSRDMLAAGAGKNPNDPNDHGWQKSWDDHLPVDATALLSDVECLGQIGSTYRGPSLGTHDARPVNCIDWYVAFAFCAWDGGRLPTEAEWNYAAAGGTEQRFLPWGNPVPGPGGPPDSSAFDAGLVLDSIPAVYGCLYGSNGGCTGIQNIAPVGLEPGGRGRWGQFDLGGNLGEWTRDSFSNPLWKKSCDNCANFDETRAGDGYVPGRVVHGGNFRGPSELLFNWIRLDMPPESVDDSIGARCARDP